MSTTYKIKEGDTLESISRRTYGDENNAFLIRDANPSLTEPLTVGTTILIPEDLEQNVKNVSFEDPDEVTVIINGTTFRNWVRVTILRSVDQISSFTLLAPFEPDNQQFRRLFKPFAFNNVSLFVGGEQFFNGVIVNVNPSPDSDSALVSVSGYAKCGVLNDCNPPPSMYPKLEFNGQDLREITQTLAKPFGVPVAFDVPPERFETVKALGVAGGEFEQFVFDPNSGVGPAFERTACKPTTRVLEFITELAQQRNLIVTSSSNGGLLIGRRPATGNPVARLDEGSPPLVEIQPTFKPQEYYSHVTGLESFVVGGEGSQYTVQNPRLDKLRPHVFTVRDAENATVKTTVNAKIGRMFGNMVSYVVIVSDWRNQSGELWKEGDTVTVNAPYAMIYNDYKMLIRSVEFFIDEEEKTAQMTLVLPESFNGETPKGLPWD